MIKGKITRPIGLDSICDDIDETCLNSELYQNSNVAPSHYLIGLNQGEGQTILTEYIASMFYQKNIRKFGGLDIYLEYKIDGSLSQLKWIFNDIKNRSVYLNDYEGCISIDITELALHLNEKQIDLFLKELKYVSQYATLILFVSNKQNRNISTLITKVVDTLKNIKVFTQLDYTYENISEVVSRMIKKNGVVLQIDETFKKSLLEIVITNEINSIEKAKEVTNELVKYSKIKGSELFLGSTELEQYTKEKLVK